MIVLQANLQRSSAGLDLIIETAKQYKAAIVLVSEPNIMRASKTGWYMNHQNNAAIKIINSEEIKVTGWANGSCYVRVDNDKTCFYSCYLSPNDSVGIFKQKLHEIQRDIEGMTSKGILVGGDFNAKSFAWNSPVSNIRGDILGDWLASLDLTLMNRGDTPTFIRNNIVSFLDITACSQTLSSKVLRWEVLLEENLSDHNTILLQIGQSRSSQQTNPNDTPSWRYQETRSEELQEKIERALNNSDANPEITIRILQGICDEMFARKTPNNNRKPIYWWSPEIAELRKNCLKLRRKVVRENAKQTRNGERAGRIREAYYTKKKELKNTIRKAQAMAWKNLCSELNDNIWGTAYKIVCKRFKMNSTKSLSTDEKMKIAEKLFPTQELPTWNTSVVDEEIPPFTMDEILQVYTEIKNKKAPGPDGLIPEVIKVFIKAAPDFCLRLYNELIKQGRFPNQWKTAKLVLIEKESKPTDIEKSYRPICLLDGLGKVYERLIKMRIENELENNGGLSPLQYGFTRKKSTVDAMLEVKRRALAAKNENKLCVMVMADVRNAFGSVSWTGVVNELKRKNISKYLTNVIQDYFKDRKVQIDDRTITLTCGVPQGSVLGALLWNIYYDPILRIELPKNTTAIAYADDLALLTTGRNKVAIELEINLAMVRVNNWMKRKNLQLAPQKTEMIMLISNRAIPEVRIEVCGTEIKSKESAKYLGVYFDKNIRMTENIKKVAEKAGKVATNLGRVMPNVGGPQNCKRKLLATVVYSTLFYGIPAWVESAQIRKYNQKLEKVQRQVMLRQCRAYRTSSTVALQVLSGTLPVDLMAEERARLIEAKKSQVNFEEYREVLQIELLGRWQNRWSQENAKGQWTKVLIGNIEPWVNRHHGDISYEVSQFLTGHGNFASYLKRMKIQESDTCIYCGETDTPQHVFFQCTRWGDERSKCWDELGEQQSEGTIVGTMLKDKNSWNIISCFISRIVQKKSEDAQRRPPTPVRSAL